MKTDNLISVLAQSDTPVSPIQPLRYLLIGIVSAAILLLIVGVVTGMGIRPDYFGAIGNAFVMSKQLLPLALCLLIFPIMKSNFYPESAPNQLGLVFLISYFAIMAMLFGYAWGGTNPDARGMAIEGKSMWRCMVSIPLYAFAIFVPLLYGLRHAAPQKPAQLSMNVALVAGSLGVVVYAFGCPEDSPLFYALWYNLALILFLFVASLAGIRFLRW